MKEDRTHGKDWFGHLRDIVQDLMFFSSMFA